MTQFLPPNLLALFAAREPIIYLLPADKLSHEKKRQNYSGLANFVHAFDPQCVKRASVKLETREERSERKIKEKAELAAYRLEQDLALWNPKENPKSSEDPYKTLFIARITYDTTESKLKREFGIYGRIRSIRVVHNIETSKPRGYAFIEYEKEADMHAAYKHADGKKIDGRRVIVDVERGRTVKGWRPRRLGGGLGGTRRGGSSLNNRYSGREDSRRVHSSNPSSSVISSHHAPSASSYGSSSQRHRRNSGEYSRDQRVPSRNNNDSRRRYSRSRSRDRHSRRHRQRSHRSRSNRSPSRDRRRHRRDISKSPSKSPIETINRRKHRRNSSIGNESDQSSNSDRSSSNRGRKLSPVNDAQLKAHC